MGTGILLDKTGVSEVTSVGLGVVVVGSHTPVKYGFKNDKTRTVSPAISFVKSGTNDLDEYLKSVVDNVTLSCPYNVAIEAVSQTHALTVLETYYYVVVAYNCNGSTGKSSEVSITITSSALAPKISWSQLNCDGYRLYRSTDTGEYTDKLITIITSGAITSFTDTGTNTGTGSPPSENTTAGAAPTYGTAPSTGYAAILSLGEVSPGQQKFFRIKVDASTSVNEDDNPRNCLLRISE